MLLYYIINMNNFDYIENTPESLIGVEIDGYCLESVLGNGSYGVVYLARHIMMDRLFAFKILQAEFSADEEAVKGFFRECKTAAKLEHPNVVQAFKAGRTANGLCYFVMEYVEGSTIEAIRINAPELLSLTFLLDVSIQLADALDYAWNSYRIIHRDIKPENLLIKNYDRKLKLADLGLAGVGSNSSPGEIVATPLYMSPEVAMGTGSYDVTGDIYSFGVMFYELSAGVPPFTGSIEELQRAHIEKLPPSLLSVNPDLDPELARYIDSMLAKNPGERPQSWADVREHLSAIRQRLNVSSGQNLVHIEEPDHDADLKDEKSRRETASWYIVIVFTIVIIIGLIVLLIVM